MIKLKVQDMACGGCVASIRDALQKLDGATEVSADLDTGIVEVSTGISPDTVRQVIEDAGFPAQLT